MRIKKHFVLRNVGGKYLIIDPSKGSLDLTHVYHLNDTAAWLWGKVFQIDFTEVTVRNLLISEYTLDQAQACHDAEVFISYLSENNFLE